MNVFGLGLEEIVFILLLVLVLFAPADIQRAGRAVGRGLNRLARSETWRLLRQTGEELRTLPGRLMKEAQLDDLQRSAQGAWRETQDLLINDPLSKSEQESASGKSALGKEEN